MFYEIGKRNSTDTHEKHTYTHALLDSKRSTYGWFLEQGAVTEQSELLEKYFVALPLYFFPDWQQDHKQTKQWYKHRKLVLINPIENMLVVVAVGAIGPTIPSRYQCGASPEVIIEGKFWTAAASGKSLLLFVDDPNNTVPLGPQQLIKNL